MTKDEAKATLLRYYPKSSVVEDKGLYRVYTFRDMEGNDGGPVGRGKVVWEYELLHGTLWFNGEAN